MKGFVRIFRSTLLLPLPLARSNWLIAAVLIGITVSGLIKWSQWDLIDTQFYDHIVARNSRTHSEHTARVVLDDNIPLAVTLTQAVTLEALAAERLIKLGAKGVFLDAQFTLRNYRKENFLACLPASTSLCSLRGNTPCLSNQGRPRRAPLDLDDEVRSMVYFPIPLSDTQPPAYDLLFGNANPPNLAISELPISADGVFRYAYTDQNALLPALIHELPKNQQHLCKNQPDRQCLAIRFSESEHTTILPLSQLASCDATVWQSLGANITGRYVVLQMTGERTPDDVHVTPIAHSTDNPGGLLNGSQIITDSIETLLDGDEPRPVPTPLLTLCFLLSIAIVVVAFAYLRTVIALLIIGGLVLIAWLTAPLFYPYCIWPVSAWLPGMAGAALTILTGHMWLNTRHSGMLARFMPPQVRHLLLLQRTEEFSGREVRAVVLMSDLAGYTTVTSLLPSPNDLFNLINRYLDCITEGLQEKYGAWLETYVGDMVCYYWPQLNSELESQEQLRTAALRAAIDILGRQQTFFEHLPSELSNSIPLEHRERIGKLLFAGMSLTEGNVFMGEMGPTHGIRKFGILGDPLNLASRLEAQTRHFNTRLIVTSELVQTARELGMLARQLSVVRVKGRIEPVTLWALHRGSDNLTEEQCAAWERWRCAFEGNTDMTQPLPGVPDFFNQDVTTLLEWKSKGLWNDKTACFELDSK